MIFVPRHLEGARRPVICNLQLSLVIVLEPKHGEMDHTAAMVSQSLSLHSLPCHALDEAEPAHAHIGKRGPHVPLRALAEQPLLGCLVIQLQCRSSRAMAAGGGDSASTDVAILAKADPCVELTVEVSSAEEWQGPFPMPPPRRILGVERVGAQRAHEDGASVGMEAWSAYEWTQLWNVVGGGSVFQVQPSVPHDMARNEYGSCLSKRR